MTVIEKRFADVRAENPDAEDLQAIKRIEQENDTSEGVTLSEIDMLRMSLNRSKTLHRDLA